MEIAHRLLNLASVNLKQASLPLPRDPFLAFYRIRVQHCQNIPTAKSARWGCWSLLDGITAVFLGASHPLPSARRSWHRDAMRRFNFEPLQGLLGIANSPPVHSCSGASGTWPVRSNARTPLRCIHGILHVSHICETLSYRVAVAMANADLYVKTSLKDLTNSFCFFLERV